MAQDTFLMATLVPHFHRQTYGSPVLFPYFAVFNKKILLCLLSFPFEKQPCYSSFIFKRQDAAVSNKVISTFIVPIPQPFKAKFPSTHYLKQERLSTVEKVGGSTSQETRSSHLCHTYALFSCDPQVGQVLAEKGDLVDGARDQRQNTVAGARILADQAHRLRHERDSAGPAFKVDGYSHVPLLAQVNQMGDICNEKQTSQSNYWQVSVV